MKEKLNLRRMQKKKKIKMKEKFNRRDINVINRIKGR